jgi:hypothetical protein
MEASAILATSTADIVGLTKELLGMRGTDVHASGCSILRFRGSNRVKQLCRALRHCSEVGETILQWALFLAVLEVDSKATDNQSELAIFHYDPSQLLSLFLCEPWALSQATVGTTFALEKS